jgi:hypothetical protein
LILTSQGKQDRSRACKFLQPLVHFVEIMTAGGRAIPPRLKPRHPKGEYHHKEHTNCHIM